MVVMVLKVFNSVMALFEIAMIGLDVPTCGGVVVPHPVLVGAAFGLVLLAGEAEVYGGAGGGLDAAEGEVGGLPDLRSACVGGKDRPADMVGAHKVHGSTLDHGHAVHPDVRV